MLAAIAPLDNSPSELAVPVPEPAPVATKVCPTVLDDAPIATKLVVPTDVIVYVAPIAKSPAAVPTENTTGSPTLKPVELVTVILSVELAVDVAVCVTVVGFHAKVNVCGVSAVLVYCDSKF